MANLGFGRRGRLLFFFCAIVLTGCSSEEPVATSATPDSTQQASGIVIETLSTRPWLVSGGDVLVEVDAGPGRAAEELQISLSGEDVTARFRQVSPRRAQALLTGLPLGESRLVAAIDGSGMSESLVLTNYSISGPIISGPHEQPFYCQTTEFTTVAGTSLGVPLDANCNVATRVEYVYWSTEEEAFLPLPQGEQPEDTGLINQNGAMVPYIVRVETGTVNRAIYEIAMLHDPASGGVDAWNRSSRWNGKLVYTHGGGCRSGWFQQGNRTGGVMRDGLLEMGYAVVSSTLNVFGQNCNDLLASETHIMVKERFVENYGVPEYTIATGSSGGSYQSHQTADNYPGVFDGIIVASSFPDVTSATIFTLADSRLLHYYFTEVDPEGFSEEQQRAVSGFGSWGSIPNLSRGAARLDPLFEPETALEEQGGEVSLPTLEFQRYHYGNPDGIRATVYDHTVNVYGRDDFSGVALRPLDNVGVQYGLAALNQGIISPEQFIALNRDIGGFDRDMNHVDYRHAADPLARQRAIESGRILFGGAGLATTPVIDYRSYTDHRENGDIHMIVHQFSTRARLRQANGHADNHVMQVGGLWGFDEEQPDLGELFRQMDSWLTAIAADQSGQSLEARVVQNRPASLNDACWSNLEGGRVKIEVEQTYTGNSRCNEIYPAYPTPRHVAGAPLANNIVSCRLKPVNLADYGVVFTDQQFSELQEIFADGVCDWSRGDASGARHQGTWLSFGPSPVNKIN